MARGSGVQLLLLRVRPRGEGEVVLPLDRPACHRWLAEGLRVALGRADAAASPFEAVELELAAGGETFVIGRGEGARLVRRAEPDDEIVAEGDDRVTEVVARLAGVTEPLGRRVVAPAAEILAALRTELAEGRAGAVHDTVLRQLVPAARAVGGRVRELLQGAHGLLQDAADELDPGREEPCTPEDLGALREEIVSRLARASAGLARVGESAEIARELAGRLRERQARMRQFLEAEKLGRKLERQKHLMEAQRRRLERARAAARLNRPGGGGTAQVHPEKAARERIERDAEAARAELSRARAALAEEDARAPEREAIAAWIRRLGDMGELLSRARAATTELAQAEKDVAALEARERRASRDLETAEELLLRARAALVAVEASPEDAARAHAEAAAAARLAEDVRRLALVRDRLRDGARALQLAKLALGESEERLEAAHREIEWNRTSAVPRDQAELPSLADLVARREAAARAVAEESANLQATRDELRWRTSELGTTAYLAPALLEAEAREKAEAAAHFGTAGRDRAEIERDITRLTATTAQLLQERERVAHEIGVLSLARLRCREVLADAEAQVPDNLRLPGALDTELAHARREHEQRVASWDSAKAQARRAEIAARDVDEILRQARAAEASASRRLIDLGSELEPLRRAGFSSWDEVAEARLSEDEMRELEAEVTEHEALERLVEEGERAGRDDMLLPRADPAQAELMHALLLHAAGLGEGRREKLAGRLAAIDRWLDALDEIGAELEQLEEAAGLNEESERIGATYEERALHALARRVMAQAEARLAAAQRPWLLGWAGEPGEVGRPLVVRDAETEAQVTAEDVLAAVGLPLALAVELARAGEPVALPFLVVSGPGPGATEDGVVFLDG